MKQYAANLKSLTPYAQGRFHDLPKLEREQPEAYDRRTYLSSPCFNGIYFYSTYGI